MTLAFHCDHEGCDSWQRLPSAKPLWLTVSGQGGHSLHFCTIDCMLHWAAAHSEPTVVIA